MQVLESFLISALSQLYTARPELSIRRISGYRPYTRYRKGVNHVDVLISLIVAVAAGVICHYIIKWLDSDK